ncbi:MAG: DUF1670 domain-containing protein [Candidatus Binatia bacterium]
MENKKMIEGPTNEGGRIAYYGYVQNPPSPSLRKKRVLLTLISDDDGDMLAKRGLAFLRQARIMRLCREAHEQGALLAYEDLTNLLLTSLSTIKRDLRLLRRGAFSVPIHRKKQRVTKGN